MRDVVYDLETDGFLDEMTTIHCLVIKDLDTGQVLSCTDASPNYPDISTGLEVLSNARRVYGHNIIRFDHPAILKVNTDSKRDRDKVIDTIVATRLRFAHIKRSDYARAKKGILPSHLIGRQSIEAWGYRLQGSRKADYKDWCAENGIEEPFAVWRPEMQEYCEDDVDVNAELVMKLRKVGVPADALKADLELAWYLAQQERNGWPIDEDRLMSLVAALTDRKQELEERLVDHFGFWYQADKEFTPKRNNSRYGYVEGATCTKLKLVEFNPGSRRHIANRLQKVYGWEPTSFTPTGIPEVNEDTLDGLDIPVTEELNEFLMIDKRLGQIAHGNQAWMKHMTTEGYQGGKLTGRNHIHHSISQVTVTHRGRHSHPNLGQVPRVGTPYGEECREIFTVPEGWKLVGSDASGLELRCLAHYMARYDGGKYGEAILQGKKEDGTDPHSLNAKALGLTRDDAKTWIYAWLYGSGNENLGRLVGGVTPEEISKYKKRSRAWSREVAWRKRSGKAHDDYAIGCAMKGQEQKNRFLSSTPALKHLKKAVDDAVVNRGWVKAPDGRKIYVRSKHSALNFLLQGAGAIICRYWIVELNRRLMDRFGTPPGGGWEHEWAAVGWIHDEVQIAVREEHAEEVAQILVESMGPIMDLFDWRIPLEAEADIGSSWRETH